MTRTDELVEKIAPKLPLYGLIAFILLMGGLGATVWFSASSDSSSDQSAQEAAKVAQGFEVQGCRSAANFEVVQARLELDKANAQIQSQTNEGFQASVQGNALLLDALAGAAPFSREAQVAAQATYDEAVARYGVAVVRSNQDPEAFLAACRASGTTTQQDPTSPSTTEAP